MNFKKGETRMKRYVALIVLMLACLLPVAAQQREEGRPRFNMEEFQGWMKSFIRERACLTQAEADLVFPVFFEMKQKQMERTRRVGGLTMEAYKKTDPKECEALLKQITALHVESSKLEQSYYARIAKLVGAKKALNMMFADDAFHREMLRKAAPHGNGKGSNGGRERGGRHSERR